MNQEFLSSIATWQAGVGLFISLCIAAPLAWKFFRAIFTGLKSIEKILHQVLPNSGESVLDRAAQAAAAAERATTAAAQATAVSERTDKTVNQIQLDVTSLKNQSAARDDRMARIENLVQHDLNHTKAQEENVASIQKQLAELTAKVNGRTPQSE